MPDHHQKPSLPRSRYNPNRIESILDPEYEYMCKECLQDRHWECDVFHQARRLINNGRVGYDNVCVCTCFIPKPVTESQSERTSVGRTVRSPVPKSSN